ncbi:MAG: hypothetical protein MRZ79_06765 [Bacteroidia bacterium]|nr:hypothetical protein [Bacteroidia bacterium]
MKNIFSTLSLAALLVSAALFTSCNPENVLAKNLEGDWEMKSFTVDGTELIGADLTSGEIDFDEYDGDEGDFTLTFVNNAGQTTIAKGEYELNSEGTEIELTYEDGTLEEYDIEVDGDEVTMEGNIDGFLIKIEADRS